MNPGATQTLLASRIVTADAVYAPGWVRVSEGRITAVGAGEPPRELSPIGGRSGDPDGAIAGADRAAAYQVTNGFISDDTISDLGDVTLVPGFVDLHSHGGGGGSYIGGDRDSALAAARTHFAHGTMSIMASLVTASPEDLLRDVAALAEIIADDVNSDQIRSGQINSMHTRSGHTSTRRESSEGTTPDDASSGDASARQASTAQTSSVRTSAAQTSTVRGIHLEGPWLSPKRAGAHAAEHLRHPDRAEIAALLEAGRGTIRMVTIAPELPGALDAIRQFVAAGVVVAIGHTDADYDTTRRAIEAGARVATHLFNAMRPLDHREPGPVLALVEDPRVSVELIADGVHVHPALIDGVRETVGVDRVLLVTDAMAAAGHEDGAYRLGDLEVEVSGGVAKLAGTGTIAGSTMTMDAAFRAAVRGVAAANDVATVNDIAAVRGASTLDDATARGASTPDDTAARGASAPDDTAAHGASAANEAASRGHARVVTGGADPLSSEDAALMAAVRQTATNPARVAGWHDVGDIAPGKRADFAVLDTELRVREVLTNLGIPA